MATAGVEDILYIAHSLLGECIRSNISTKELEPNISLIRIGRFVPDRFSIGCTWNNERINLEQKYKAE